MARSKASSESRAGNRRIYAVFFPVMAFLLVLATSAAFFQGREKAIGNAVSMLDKEARLQINFLHSQIQRVRMVPLVVARSRCVLDLLRNPDTRHRDRTNLSLEEMVEDVGAEAIYVMDRDGLTLASSNWRSEKSFVGKNYGFRPYFRQAIDGGHGQFTALGVTSKSPGHYLSEPVVDGEDISGVLVLKLSVEQIEKGWREIHEPRVRITQVTDAQGVILMTSYPGWRYRSLFSLNPETQSRIEAARQYSGKVLEPLMVTATEDISPGVRKVSFKDFPERTFIVKGYEVPGVDWRLYNYADISDFRDVISRYAGVTLLGGLVIVLGTFALIQRWRYQGKLVLAALRDPLTGLYTRLYMDEAVEAMMSRHERDHTATFALILFDLDGFKKINDLQGHLKGDAVLKRIGAIIRSSVRSSDVAVRFGGEELAIFTPCLSVEDAQVLAERVRTAVEAEETEGIRVTISAGVALHVAGEPLNQLIARADRLLYRAKQEGRNRVCY